MINVPKLLKIKLYLGTKYLYNKLMKENIFINEVFEQGYEIAEIKELYYTSKKTKERYVIRDGNTLIYFADGDYIGYTPTIEETDNYIKYYYFYCDGNRGTLNLPAKSQLKLTKTRKVTTLNPIYSKLKKIKINLSLFKEDLQKTSIKLIKDKELNPNTLIEELINKYGTLQKRNAIKDETFFDREYELWKILLIKLVPSVSSFIDSKINISVDELNECFANVRPVYDDIYKNAFKLESEDLLGAISMLLKTSNLKKPPITNCLNCGKEINQSQEGGRPLKFCKNNNKCKMQYYRK